MSRRVSATIDKLLTNASRKLDPMKFNFIHEKVLPKVMVKQTSGKVGYYDKEHLRIVNTVMGGRGKAPYIETGVKSSDTYYIDKHGLAGTVYEEEYDNVDKPFDAERDIMDHLLSHLMLGKEKSFADILFSGTYITNTAALSGQSQWSDYNNSDPVSKIEDTKETIRGTCGFDPNKMIISKPTFKKLKFHPGILASLGFTHSRPGGLKLSELEEVFSVKILVGDSMYNSVNRGQTDSLTDIWGKNCLLYYAPDSPSLRDQALGFYLQRKEARKVYKWANNNPPNSKDILVEDSYDNLLTDVNCAYLLTAVIA